MTGPNPNISMAAENNPYSRMNYVPTRSDHLQMPIPMKGKGKFAFSKDGKGRMDFGKGGKGKLGFAVEKGFEKGLDNKGFDKGFGKDKGVVFGKEFGKDWHAGKKGYLSFGDEMQMEYTDTQHIHSKGQGGGKPDPHFPDLEMRERERDRVGSGG